MLRAEELCRRVKDRVLFEGLSFSVEPGETLVVQAPSGAGKSLLLRLLAWLDPPPAGAWSQAVQLLQDLDALDSSGAITGLSADPGSHTEPAAIGDPDVQAFLRRLDIDLVRVLEDVVDLLVARGVFRFTDLPDSAQEKLLFRKNLRSQWHSVPDPLGSDEGLL